jgi:two-component system nitrogen regulation response regulator GlnG
MTDGEMSILIVEDELPIRALLMALLGERFHCQAAATAEAAIRLLDSQCFHLVLADIGLPGTSGLELCRHIATHNSRTVVVLISGKIDLEAATEARAAGAFDFLPKPFDITDVLWTVNFALAHQAEQMSTHSATRD